jgi:DNA-binding NarL/FixJ family response regulator
VTVITTQPGRDYIAGTIPVRTIRRVSGRNVDTVWGEELTTLRSGDATASAATDVLQDALNDERGRRAGAEIRRAERTGADRLRAPAGSVAVWGGRVTRILIADGHAIVRHGVRAILEAEDAFEIVAEASNGDEAYSLALRLIPDLAVMDVSMTCKGGIAVARRLAAECSQVRIVLLSLDDGVGHIFDALAAGVAGYVLKSAADSELVRVCRAVADGSERVYPEPIGSLVEAHAPAAYRSEVPKGNLTERENEVLQLIAKGMSSKEIAERLVISVKTVRRHRANLLGKLGLHDRVALTRYAIRNDIVKP